MIKRVLAALSSYNYKQYDLLLMIAAILLGCIGSVTLFVMPNIQEGLYIKQIIGIVVGILGAIVVSLVSYKVWAKLSWLMYLANLVMLIGVKYTKFGIEIYHAKRWLGLSRPDGSIIVSFQPSEVSKFVLIICIAVLFNLFRNKLDKFYPLLVIGAMFVVPLFLILTQTDLSTSIVLVIMFAVMVFASGFNIKYILAIIIIAIPLGIFAFWYVQQPDPMFINEYQQNRILSFLHPEQYPDLMYQQANAVVAISSGGLLGKQLLNDAGPRGTLHVPVKESDFIFTGIAEEFGFLGGVVVILLFGFMAFKIIKISLNAKDLTGRLIGVGCATIFIAQAFVNIGVVTQILPNTGIPLPFVSNGLSSVVSSYFMLGMVQNIAINTNEVSIRESEDYIK